MKITLDRTEIKFDALELFGNLHKEDKLEFVKMVMLWDDEVFTEVVDSLAADEYCSPTFNEHIFKARIRLLERLPEGLRDVVKKLMRDTETSKLRMEQNRNYMWKLSHNWPWECPECHARMPRMPEEPKLDFSLAPHMADSEADAVIKAGV